MDTDTLIVKGIAKDEMFFFSLQSYFKVLRYLTSTSSQLQQRLCRARDLFGSQIPVTTGGFELRISCIQSSYLTHYFVCKRFAVQTLF